LPDLRGHSAGWLFMPVPDRDASWHHPCPPLLPLPLLIATQHLKPLWHLTRHRLPSRVCELKRPAADHVRARRCGFPGVWVVAPRWDSTASRS